MIGHASKEDSYYDFYADIVHADLAAITLDKRDSVSQVNFRTLANFTRKATGDILGNISVKSLEYRNRNGLFNIGDISIKSLSGNNNYSVYLNSTFAEATYTGTDFLTTFIERMIRTTAMRHLPALIPEKEIEEDKKAEHYSLNLTFHDTKAVSQMILPGLIIADKSSFKANIDENRKSTFSYISSESGYGKNLAKKH